MCTEKTVNISEAEMKEFRANAKKTVERFRKKGLLSYVKKRKEKDLEWMKK